MIASRNLDACEEVAAELGNAGWDAGAESFDQGDEASIVALKDRVLRRFGRSYTERHRVSGMGYADGRIDIV